MAKILFLVNHSITIYNFRLELVQALIKEGHQVIISSPYGNKIDDLIKEGCEFENIDISRHGMNPIKECVLIAKYIKLIKKVKPDVVLSYTIKPNIYGGMACSLTKTPYMVNVTGLGTAVENGGIMQKILCLLYKISLRKAHKIFLQNTYNAAFFAEKGLYKEKHQIIPGSGVNLKRFSVIKYPDEKENIKFLMIARVMKDKGADEYISAAKELKEKYPDIEFHICGLCEEEYKTQLDEIKDKGIIIYHGMVDDVRTIIKDTHCTVLPSYHEGMPNVLLESAACARPVIATNIPGCCETFDEGVTGFGCEVRSTQSLVDAIEKFLSLSHKDKENMGKAGRIKIEKRFDRQIVVEAYKKEINTIINK